MKTSFLKRIARRTLFRNGAVRRIVFGPCAGFSYRVSEATGMSAWYSGPEREVQSAFQAIVRAGDTVMDVGANWGLHTLLLSRLAGPNGRVFAFEPYAPILDELSWHVHANRCSNVNILSTALSDECGLAAFEPGNSAFTGRLCDQSERGVLSPLARREVVARRLDELLGELDVTRIKLIKIDVEGAESRVIDGAFSALNQFRPSLVIELHTPEQDVAVARKLSDAGYDLERLSPGLPIRNLKCGWPDREGVWGTILARPRER